MSCMAETQHTRRRPHLESRKLIAKATGLFGAARCGCLRVEKQHHYLPLKVLQADAFSIVRLELPTALQRTVSVLTERSAVAAMGMSRQRI